MIPSALPSDVPKAYLCISSSKLMEDPVLALCSHIFDRSVVKELEICPQDGQKINKDKLIGLGELKKAIDDYKFAQGLVKPQAKWANFTQTLREKKSPEILVTSAPKKPALKPSFSSQNVHDDDIHGLIKISDDLFLSGSKDTTVKLWDARGSFISYLRDDAISCGYESWVTTLVNLDETYSAYGTRDGHISVFKNDMSDSIFLKNESHVVEDSLTCKERNVLRILCLEKSKLEEEPTKFYAGVPGALQKWDYKTRRLEKIYKTGTGDWVYSIKTIGSKNLLVACGGDLQKWDYHEGHFKRNDIIKETMKQRHMPQRPLISSIEYVDSMQSKVLLSIFGGHIKLMDLEKAKCERLYQEHTGRVWMSLPLKENLFASCSDDKTVKFWDLRQAKSALTVKDQPGRVSCLLKMKEDLLISASCPDDLNASTQKASFTFWDLRYFDKTASGKTL